MKTPWFEQFQGKARQLWIKPREFHIKYTYEVQSQKIRLPCHIDDLV